MATLVFGAVGTLVGGPLGGAIGALLGNQLDRAIVGSPSREGARLKELAVSTSSYGQPIPRLFGATRAAGTIIWATDLRESSESLSGGKGRPSTTQYAYSISLAVALSSRPITRIGRIWADGNLLRGEAGDMKTGGTLRVHTGRADQEADPLLAAALGAHCPAHRGLAYAVLEDLQLGEFGNRIPALSFEVFADGEGPGLIRALIEPVEAAALTIPEAAAIGGFAHEGGSLASALDALDTIVPLAVETGGAGLAIGPGAPRGAAARLPAPIAWPDGEFGIRTGQRHARAVCSGPTALRYHDSDRDYQPGLQRAGGRAAPGGERIIELPACMVAGGAAALIDAAALRARARKERRQVRIASLDPAFAPGRIVAIEGDGLWDVVSWEWRNGGVELDLARAQTVTTTPVAADSGDPWRPVDRLPAATVLRAFELPWDGTGAADAARLHVAAGAGAGRWSGAALYAERDGALVSIGTAPPPRAIIARLEGPLGPSPALMFEADARIDLHCDDSAARFASIEGAAMAGGANRLLIGAEIVQFLHAELLGEGSWRLSGLLRGRGGTEVEACAGHAAGSSIVLLDERLLVLDAATLDPATERLAAIGAGDPEPVFASVVEAGRSRRPLAPVHPRIDRLPGGAVRLEWTRRARGGWLWTDGVAAPLVEESEIYEIGAGPIETPLATWITRVPELTLEPSALASFPPGTGLWVRQVGTHARSPVLLLHIVD